MSTCEAGNDFNNAHMGARISSVFVILITSSAGAFLPILSSKYSFIRMPSWLFFGAKYFGTGVIVATAFIHLLEPAADNLGEECLGGTFEDYPWAFGIALMSLFTLFFFELLAFNFIKDKVGAHSHNHFEISSKENELKDEDEEAEHETEQTKKVPDYPDHFRHANSHQDPESKNTPVDLDKETYYGQLVSTLVLEFGIIFHSVFVGLTLAISGEEFQTLYVVIVFHQMFEGLGLGTRIASTEWPMDKRWLPFVLALCYGLTTPISIAIGLGVRNSYAPGSRTALITNGVFDAISAGILIYTGLVELMAHEFLFSDQFKGPDGSKRMMIAFVVVCFGAGVMALLGRWA
ncbi:zinc-regulated transporter 2 [[Candida] jaroonii]|uniref:Zinc-regulated transporter 2 n=1 Tax=[Candida] jaroonii TaxID=467808 RepID=A0ACA9Y7T3_9ASCO|nr:zinc-regulated transporter 2 [[Candida] jaroonii]